MYYPTSFSVAAARFAAVALLLSARLVHAAPTRNSNTLDTRADTSFADSCTNIVYFGYCRIEATCTLDGSALSTGAKTQHTILDLGQCVGYSTKTEELTWRSASVSRWNTSYCEPCSQCTIDPDTTEMKCDCEYSDESRDHETQLLLSDHVYNQDGLLSCLNVQGDADLNYSAVTTTASSK